MNAKRKPWKSTTQQIVIGLVMAILVVAIIEANTDYDADCGWSFMGSYVSHSRSGGVERIRIGRGRCRLEVDLAGDVDFAPDNRGVSHLGEGASLKIKEKLRRERRRLDVESGTGGEPRYTWYVNSLPKPFDDEARDWLAKALPRLYRTSGLDADGRVQQLWDAGGFDAVLEEMEAIESGRVRSLYLSQVLGRSTRDDELVRALHFGRRGISSDHELARSLSRLDPERLASPQVREAWVDALRSIDSDHELRKALSATLADGIDPEMVDAMLEAAATVGSDYELAQLLTDIAKQLPDDQALPPNYFLAFQTIGSDNEHRRALAAALARPALTPQEAGALLETAPEISSDYELAELLGRFVADYPRHQPLPEPFFQALHVIDSDSAMRQTLTAVVDHRDLDRPTTMGLLKAARTVSSDYELATFLVRLVEAYPPELELPQELDAVLRTVDSTFERGKVDTALEKRELAGQGEEEGRGEEE